VTLKNLQTEAVMTKTIHAMNFKHQKHFVKTTSNKTVLINDKV